VNTLIVTCPECGEDLEISPSEWLEFQVGDVLACDSCGTELEVVSTDPPEFEALASLTICPKCDTEFELSDDDLERGSATCPHCQFAFKLEFDEP
jgi:alpha-aminoadipate/glutamate carrier protein LysW